jgi:putative transposase
MSHSLSSLFTHVVFSTKDRTACISDAIKPQMWRYIGGIIRELEGKALIVNGMSDHVHILLQLSPAVSIADTMRVVKTNSSRWAREKWPNARFAWQTGYAAFSVSRSDVRAVLQYIENQQQHHRRMSFQEELVALLKKHGVPYDQRYIWN